MKGSSPLLGECLFGKREPCNGVDKNAVAVICLNSCGSEEVVGHAIVSNSATLLTGT